MRFLLIADYAAISPSVIGNFSDTRALLEQSLSAGVFSFHIGM